MKSVLMLVLLALLLCAPAVPTKRLLMASTKDLGAIFVRIPRFQCNRDCWDLCGERNRKRNQRRKTPRTIAPSTRTFVSTGGSPAFASGPPPGTGSCVSCSVKNFGMVNRYRASNGLNKLGWSEHLGDLAEQWSKTMYDTRVFMHSEFNYWENIIWGYGMYTWDNVAGGFFDGWKSSPGHDQSMRLPSHKCMGVGIYGDGNLFYGTQIFSNECP